MILTRDLSARSRTGTLPNAHWLNPAYFGRWRAVARARTIPRSRQHPLLEGIGKVRSCAPRPGYIVPHRHWP
jgi:hypothetical protein